MGPGGAAKQITQKLYSHLETVKGSMVESGLSVHLQVARGPLDSADIQFPGFGVKVSQTTGLNNLAHNALYANSAQKPGAW